MQKNESKNICNKRYYKLENLSKFKMFVGDNIQDVDKYYTTLSGDFFF